ncbi:MarR family winged helix-turn-helix transcriptional regulator [Nocardia sp. CDC160]|uniref:MarR family winged helix-turn-helix transcriptional regulator n=1 Tax=Nocardia sp. CDC160 TaxID=3112166 RepID=UPI002DBD5670|nr:MarR family winged helix-turn-helix transcriptional regulator [Nocardia sp. CDC160]MEC3915376.1 MarR family winged helix-turn-helix transcriptional regulator [Nocardia sp. CDC160]
MTEDDRTPDELLDAIGPAFGKLKRGVLQEVENPISTKDATRAMVLGMVLGCPTGPDGSTGEMTVGGIAAALCVDPSVASRMVTDNIKAGYLRRVPSQLDGRRAVLELSPQGIEFMAEFRRRQRAAFEYITADWPEQDRLDFARLMLRYVDAIDNLKNRGPATGD